MVVVVVPPRLKRPLQVRQIQKPMQRETLASQRAVEGFDERIVHRLAGPAELEQVNRPLRPAVPTPSVSYFPRVTLRPHFMNGVEKQTTFRAPRDVPGPQSGPE